MDRKAEVETKRLVDAYWTKTSKTDELREVWHMIKIELSESGYETGSGEIAEIWFNRPIRGYNPAKAAETPVEKDKPKTPTYKDWPELRPQIVARIEKEVKAQRPERDIIVSAIMRTCNSPREVAEAQADILAGKMLNNGIMLDNDFREDDGHGIIYGLEDAGLFNSRRKDAKVNGHDWRIFYYVPSPRMTLPEGDTRHEEEKPTEEAVLYDSLDDSLWKRESNRKPTSS